jgi:hypothetical protein
VVLVGYRFFEFWWLDIGWLFYTNGCRAERVITGWQLGEHGEWCKHTNFELAARAPMMIHVPG